MEKENKLKNYLFLIGINKYEWHKELEFCVDDVKNFKEALLEKYDFEESNIIELYDEEATNENIQNQFLKFSEILDENTNLCIYYSGHGGKMSMASKNFWIPSDAHANRYVTWLANETILHYLKQIKAHHIFLISDSCFSWSLLIKNSHKSISDYFETPSRWLLAAGKDLVYDGPMEGYDSFGSTITSFLKENNDDLRVGKLIEHVKQKFENSEHANPQGSPFSDPAHKGGEFVFKVLHDDVSEEKDMRGNKDFLTILKLFRPSCKFTEMTSPGGFEDRTNKIGYQLFKEKDKVFQKENYFLYLYSGIFQKNTYNHLKLKYPEIFSHQKLVILIPKEKNQVNPEKRKSNISKLFQPLSIYYVDDFIREECTPIYLTHKNEHEYSSYLFINNFISPKALYAGSTIEAKEFMKKWFSEIDKSITVIKGSGGIGKTTFVQYLADEFQSINPFSSVVFIDSKEIYNELLRKEDSIKSLNVYSFYEAEYERHGNLDKKLNEDLFRLNLDAGNFILIIDGLDEIISKHPNFNVDEFLKSIELYTSEMGSGKVIITCRTFFWEVSKFNSNKLQVIELLPFNMEQTTKYFDVSFQHDENKIRKAMKIIKDFKSPVATFEETFDPYVLDVVYKIISEDQTSIDFDIEFNSKILEQTLKNDYIIYCICQREMYRVSQISIDDQINFFSYLSVKRRGIIAADNLKNEVPEALKKHIDFTNIQALKAHPFILVKGKSITFKYDFLTDYFKSILITRYIKLETNFDTVTEDFINIIAENCWYGSDMISNIKDRITNWGEDNLLKCSYLIEQIEKYENIDKEQKLKAISGIFNICLSINSKKKSNQIDENTSLIKSLFGKGNNIISKLYIRNIHNGNGIIKFNFENLIIEDSIFNNFQNFWYCRFNDKTFFKRCKLLNLDFNKNSEITLPEDNLHDCLVDNKIKEVFKRNFIIMNNSEGQVKDFLEKFFGMFFSKGKLERQGIEDFIKRRFSSVCTGYDYEKTIKFFDKENFFEYFTEHREEKIKIKDEYKADVIKFVKDGEQSKLINNLVKKYREFLK